MRVQFVITPAGGEAFDLEREHPAGVPLPVRGQVVLVDADGACCAAWEGTVRQVVHCYDRAGFESVMIEVDKVRHNPGCGSAGAHLRLVAVPR